MRSGKEEFIAIMIAALMILELVTSFNALKNTKVLKEHGHPNSTPVAIRTTRTPPRYLVYVFNFNAF